MVKNGNPIKSLVGDNVDERREKQNDHMMKIDRFFIIATGFLAALTVGSVLKEVASIISNQALRTGIFLVAGISILSLACALGGVFSFLCKNKDEIYNEESLSQESDPQK